MTSMHKAQVDNPDISLPALLSRTIIKNKPYIVSEINESFPNDYMAEGIPLCAAYALLQDWDGFFWHSYTGGHFGWNDIWQEQAIKHHLRLCSDPLRMSQMAIGALMFLRGDVQAAKTLVERTVPYDWALDSLRVKSDLAHMYWLPYLSNRASLVHRVAFADAHAQDIRPAAGDVTVPSGKIVSDTGELVWEESPTDGRVIIDAPVHQGVIMRAGTRATSNMTIDLQTRFAAIQLASLDDKPIAGAGSMLLVAVGRVANSGMKWDADHHSVREHTGHAPTCIEPVVATLTLSGLMGAKRVLVQPLDGCGQPLGKARRAARTGAVWTIALTGKPATTWYQITVER
jgi:hypothetical protein